jgi:AcrR family transcriptional regulator
MATEVEATPQRIIEAAGEVFAVKGFEAATVREICKLAGANLAAVNYHFGDKRRLYIEAVKRAHVSRELQFPLPAWDAGTPATQKLADFILTLLKRMTSPTNTQWEGELMSREIARPSEACEELARESIRPHFAVLNAILLELMPAAGEVKRHLTAFSIVGQCLHYKIAEPITRQLVSPQEYGTYQPELLAEHITEFTLRGIGVPPSAT